MGSVVLLFLFAALALFLLGCKEGIILLKKRNRICKTTGRIVDVSTLAAETMKVYNSKWALVMYSVDGRMITSQNRIVVPMSSNVGDPVDIQYDTPRFDIAVNHPCKKICFILPSDGDKQMKHFGWNWYFPYRTLAFRRSYHDLRLLAIISIPLDTLHGLMYKKVLLIKNDVTPSESADFSNAHPGIQTKKNANIAWAGIVQRCLLKTDCSVRLNTCKGFFCSLTEISLISAIWSPRSFLAYSRIFFKIEIALFTVFGASPVFVDPPIDNSSLENCCTSLRVISWIASLPNLGFGYNLNILAYFE